MYVRVYKRGAIDATLQLFYKQNKTKQNKKKGVASEVLAMMKEGTRGRFNFT